MVRILKEIYNLFVYKMRTQKYLIGYINVEIIIHYGVFICDNLFDITNLSTSVNEGKTIKQYSL